MRRLDALRKVLPEMRHDDGNRLQLIRQRNDGARPPAVALEAAGSHAIAVAARSAAARMLVQLERRLADRVGRSVLGGAPNRRDTIAAGGRQAKRHVAKEDRSAAAERPVAAGVRRRLRIPNGQDDPNRRRSGEEMTPGDDVEPRPRPFVAERAAAADNGAQRSVFFDVHRFDRRRNRAAGCIFDEETGPRRVDCGASVDQDGGERERRALRERKVRGAGVDAQSILTGRDHDPRTGDLRSGRRSDEDLVFGPHPVVDVSLKIEQRPANRPVGPAVEHARLQPACASVLIEQLQRLGVDARSLRERQTGGDRLADTPRRAALGRSRREEDGNPRRHVARRRRGRTFGHRVRHGIERTIDGPSHVATGKGSRFHIAIAALNFGLLGL